MYTRNCELFPLCMLHRRPRLIELVLRGHNLQFHVELVISHCGTREPGDTNHAFVPLIKLEDRPSHTAGFVQRKHVYPLPTRSVSRFAFCSFWQKLERLQHHRRSYYHWQIPFLTYNITTTMPTKLSINQRPKSMHQP